VAAKYDLCGGYHEENGAESANISKARNEAAAQLAAYRRCSAAKWRLGAGVAESIMWRRSCSDKYSIYDINDSRNGLCGSDIGWPCK